MFRLWLNFVLVCLFIILIGTSTLAYLMGHLEFQATVVLVLSSIGLMMANLMSMVPHSLERISNSFQRPRPARRDTNNTP